MRKVTERVGDVIGGRYELLSLLGRGGQSAVYRARDQKSGDEVAVSVHIYKAAMEGCSMFIPQDGEWFTRADKALPTDEAH